MADELGLLDLSLFEVEYKYPIVMAIEIGTLTSAVAYVLRQKEEVLYDRIPWDSRSPFSRHTVRVPSLLLYARTSSSSSSSSSSPSHAHTSTTHALLEWGWRAYWQMHSSSSSVPREDRLLLSEFFPLLLDDSLTTHGPIVLENGLTPLETVTDYLKGIGKFLKDVVVEKDHFKDGLGMGVGEERGKREKVWTKGVRYVMPVPVGCSERAKECLRQAAVGAGLVEEKTEEERLEFVSELEAAAMFCLKTVKGYAFKEGDRFLICHSGADTTSVAIFQVVDVLPHRYSNGLKRIKQVRQPSLGSSSSGTDFLEANMSRFLERLLQPHPQYRQLHAPFWTQILEDFRIFIRSPFAETGGRACLDLPPVMTVVEGTAEDSTTVNSVLDDNDEIGVERGSLIIPMEVLEEEVFEPAVGEVLELIQEQLEGLQMEGEVEEGDGGGGGGKECGAIFLIGEFGSLHYVKKRATEEFLGWKGKGDRGVKVVRVPLKEEVAALRGAVYLSLDMMK